MAETSTILTAGFWRAAGERAVKTFCQVAASLLVASGKGLLDTDWVTAVSVSGMALAHGLNTNVLRKWLIRERKRDETSQPKPVEKRTQSAPKLLAVTMLPERAPDTLVPTTEKSPPPSLTYSTPPIGNAAGRINIEIGDARIVVDANVNATALSTVLDCLRGTRSR